LKRLRQEIIGIIDEIIERFNILDEGIKRIGERIDKHRQDCEKLKREVSEIYEGKN